MPGKELPSQDCETVQRERQRATDKFLALREANIAAYGATSEEQFITPVGGDIADQRTYLIHQIRHTHLRIEAFRGISGLPDLSRVTREQLLIALGNTGDRLRMVLELEADWNRMIKVPYSDTSLTGATVLADIANHEAHHEGMNRVILGHFGIPLPAAVIRPFGK